uniref:Alpha/beta hydrolase n=1 Tax=Streptomyces sp. NBC_00119 TaxID=2975659 RepID=A0AAU1UH10_9ACTN
MGRRQDAAFFFHARAVADLPQARTYEHDAGGVYFAESHAADLAPQILDFTAGLRTSD